MQTQDSAVERLADRYFPKDGSGSVRNLHFFVAPGADVTAEQLAQQVLHADEQIANGTAREIKDVDGFGF